MLNYDETLSGSFFCHGTFFHGIFFLFSDVKMSDFRIEIWAGRSFFFVSEIEYTICAVTQISISVSLQVKFIHIQWTYLLYMSTSGFHSRCGGILKSFTPPYSDEFHLKFISFHSCRAHRSKKKEENHNHH